MLFIEENPFEKGFPSNSLPKTFSVKFCPYRALINKVKLKVYLERPIWAKLILKVFGKGFGVTPRGTGRCPKDRGDKSLLAKPFFKRVSLNRKYEIAI